VQHCLLGVKASKLSDIKTVTSHIHALPQCRDIIAKNKWKKIVAIDTAAAAQNVAENRDSTLAAIASSLAAEIYGLDILATDIADIKDNTTRFVIMSPNAIRPQPPSEKNHTRVMTSLVFRVRSVPAALYKALGGFATNGVNLTKIESYLVDGAFDAAQFYCEIEGHPDSDAMQRALEELEFFGKYDVLGVYPAHQFRLTKTPGAVLD
jgi:prephenate dehydratase